MKLINKLKDAFTVTDFNIEGTMKVNELCKEFRKSFGLSLRVYKGKILADDGRMTIKSLDQRTNTTVNFDNGKLVIRANQNIGDVEQAFLNHFGIIVQIADAGNKKLLSNDLSLGNARRQE